MRVYIEGGGEEPCIVHVTSECKFSKLMSGGKPTFHWRRLLYNAKPDFQFKFMNLRFKCSLNPWDFGRGMYLTYSLFIRYYLLFTFYISYYKISRIKLKRVVENKRSSNHNFWTVRCWIKNWYLLYWRT